MKTTIYNQKNEVYLVRPSAIYGEKKEMWFYLLFMKSLFSNDQRCFRNDHIPTYTRPLFLHFLYELLKSEHKSRVHI